MDPRDDYEDFGNQGVGLEDNEEVALFRSLEHELESLVQRYRVPTDELRQLFEVSDVYVTFYGNFLISLILLLYQSGITDCKSMLYSNIAITLL
jgi:hypothetical protein